SHATPRLMRPTPTRLARDIPGVRLGHPHRNLTEGRRQGLGDQIGPPAAARPLALPTLPVLDDAGTPHTAHGVASLSPAAHHDSCNVPTRVGALPCWVPGIAWPHPAPPASTLSKSPVPQSFTRSCTPFSPARVDNSLG